ncbi:MAG: hypothetical protein U9P14_03020 [Gemmatimonadota bacterium]|nr:hypothetical protein [Gemmatimonadota bacterium]
MPKKKISKTNTKKEILEAYEDLQVQLQQVELAPAKPPAAKPQQSGPMAKPVAQERTLPDPTIVDTVKKYSLESIMHTTGDLKLRVNQLLSELVDDITSQIETLRNLDKAIEVEKNILKNLYEIKVEAETLDRLRREQEEAEGTYRETMESTRREWEREQAVHEQEATELNEELMKQRKREQEEYDYDLKLSRRKDQDRYEEKQAAQEKELAEKKQQVEQDLDAREQAINEREKHMDELEGELDTLKQRFEPAIEKARQEGLQQAAREAAHQAELLARETEGEKKLLELKILNLENTIGEQQKTIKSLSQQLEQAQKHAQNLAARVIDGSSAGALAAMNRLRIDQARQQEAE